MGEIMTAIRRATRASQMILPTEEAQTSHERSETKAADRNAAAEFRRGPEARLLSSEATAAVDTAFNTLTQTVMKHEPTLEDVVR